MFMGTAALAPCARSASLTRRSLRLIAGFDSKGQSPLAFLRSVRLFGSGSQQIRGSCSPLRRSSTRAPPMGPSRSTPRPWLPSTRPITAAWHRRGSVTEEGECRFGHGGRKDGDEASLVRDIKRVEPKDLAGAAHRVGHRDGGFDNAQAPIAVPAISISAVASPPRVRSRRQWISIPRRSAPGPGGRAARSRWRSALRSQPLPRRHDGDAMPRRCRR